jgi:hypothetical protein
LKQKDAKRSEKREVKFYSEIVKTQVKRIQIRFISLISEKIFLSETGSPYSPPTGCWLAQFAATRQTAHRCRQAAFQIYKILCSSSVAEFTFK